MSWDGGIVTGSTGDAWDGCFVPRRDGRHIPVPGVSGSPRSVTIQIMACDDAAVAAILTQPAARAALAAACRRGGRP